MIINCYVYPFSGATSGFLNGWATDDGSLRALSTMRALFLKTDGMAVVVDSRTWNLNSSSLLLKNMI
jgi:hypothetical protein